MADDVHAEVTINDRTKISLGWVVALLGGFGTLLTSVVLWAAHIQDAASHSVELASSASARVQSVEADVKVIREAQIRIETKMGMAPSYRQEEKSQ